MKNYGGELRAGAERSGSDPRADMDRPGIEGEDGLLNGPADLPDAVGDGGARPPPLLQVRNLATRFRVGARRGHRGRSAFPLTWTPARRWPSSAKSGSGKSMTALSILRLIPNPPGRIEDGEILFDGLDLLKLSDAEIRDIRGNKIAMIFQEPMSSLNPALTVGLQVGEPINRHGGAPWSKTPCRRATCLDG